MNIVWYVVTGFINRSLLLFWLRVLRTCLQKFARPVIRAWSRNGVILDWHSKNNILSPSSANSPFEPYPSLREPARCVLNQTMRFSLLLISWQICLRSKVVNLASNPQPWGADPCMYVFQWQDGPVEPPGTGFAFDDSQGSGGVILTRLHMTMFGIDGENEDPCRDTKTEVQSTWTPQNETALHLWG
jgi:hypothetical protein